MSHADRSSRPLFAVAVLASLACSTKSVEPEPNATAEPPASVDATKAPVAIAAAPAKPAPPQAPTTPAKPIVAAPAPPIVAISHAPLAADAPTFTKVTKRKDDAGRLAMELLRTDDGEVFAGMGPMLLRLRPDGTIEHDAAWVKGIDDASVDLALSSESAFWWETLALGGSWRDDAVIALRPSSDIRGLEYEPQSYRRSGDAWVRMAMRKPKFDAYPRVLGRWKDGSLLALQAFVGRYPQSGSEDEPADPRLRRIVGAIDRDIAAQKRLVVLRGAAKAPAFGAEQVTAFASLPSGEIIATIADGERTRVVHYDDAVGRERDVVLPGAGPEPASVQLAMTASNRAWLVGESADDAKHAGYVAQWDGDAWREVATECSYGASSLSIDRDGDPWFICSIATGENDSRTVLFRVHANVLEEVPTPADAYAVVAQAPDDVWLLTTSEPELALYHGGPAPTEPFLLPEQDEINAELLALAPARAWTKQCRATWIPLVAGADRTAVEAKLAVMTEPWTKPAVIEANIAGKGELGVLVLESMGEKPHFGAEAIRLLGADAGTPTCNARMPI